MKRTLLSCALGLSTAAYCSQAAAEDPRFHLTAGAAHAVGGSQEREFGAGGGGSATVELPVGSVFGVQANAGGVALSQGSPPANGALAQKSTGAAFIGTVGVRFRPLGATRVAGPWIDANGGLAQTGPNGRVAIDAHLGWDFRVSKASRWDVGPFVGYTQIFQPASALSSDDAHIAWAGLQISIGAPEKKHVDPVSVVGRAPPASDERDGVAEVEDVCPSPAADGTVPPGCPQPEVKLEGDRIVLGDVIHFEYDSPVIRHESHGLVRHVAKFIVEHPEILAVSIEGHADARGTLEYNQRLSEARASSTLALLVEFGVDGSRLHVIGHGKTRLKVETALADPRNRRVEFIVTTSGATAHAGARQ